MVERAVSSTPALDFDFAACLEQLESDQQEQRLTALKQLGVRHDPRSMTVLQGLQEDENPEIRRQAGVLFRKLQQLGIRPKSPTTLGTSRERFTIGTTIQLVDEVCAVWGNRAWDYLIGALTAGAPKLFLMILLFYIDVDRRGFGSAMTLDPWLLFALILVYPLFFRPFAWELLGKTFLSGWPERSIRQRFQRRLTFGSFTLLLRRNLFPAMINVLLLGLFLVVPSTNLNLEVLYLGLILFFWVIPLNFCRLPLTLLDPLTPTSVEHASELGSAHAPTIRSSLTDFTWFIAYWYLAIAISFVFVASYFVRSTSGVHSLCGVLLADILLDPLWIGFHLTLTYLLKQQKAAA